MDCDFVSWRGHRVHVKVTGQGHPPLLLITGLGGSTDMWTPFAQQFQHRCAIEPLLLPWGGIPSVRYVWNGTAFHN